VEGALVKEKRTSYAQTNEAREMGTYRL